MQDVTIPASVLPDIEDSYQELRRHALYANLPADLELLDDEEVNTWTKLKGQMSRLLDSLVSYLKEVAKALPDAREEDIERFDRLVTEWSEDTKSTGCVRLVIFPVLCFNSVPVAALLLQPSPCPQ